MRRARQQDDVDLLDPRSLSAERARGAKHEDDLKDDFRRDADGGIVVEDEHGERRKVGKRKRDWDDGEDDEEHDDDLDGPEATLEALIARAAAEVRNANAAAGEPRAKKKARKEQAFGKESKARKAGGDAKYRDAKTDPVRGLVRAGGRD